MGLRDAWNALLGKSSTVDYLGFDYNHVHMVQGLTPAELYRSQPHLQTVVGFLARNVAQISLPLYERVGDNDRRRVLDDPVARLLKCPNPFMTRFELLESLVSDYSLFGEAYWWVRPSVDAVSGWTILPLSPDWLSERRGGTFAAKEYVFVINNDLVIIPAREVITFHGWNPGRPKKGTAPVEALKQVLSEQISAWEYRNQLWRRGGRVGSYLTRPKDAPVWSKEAKDRFKKDWAEFQGSGAKAGSTPLLEDGIELKRVGFTAKEEQWVEATKLSLQTVASIYHVNPVMVGILDNANFSNTKEFRKMLYSETLGPLLEMIQDRLNTFLLPLVSEVQNGYLEFNIQSKLAGDFEESAAQFQASVGAPWMTRNEARAKNNMPAVVGGDDLIVPLNVLTGGQASPLDSGSQNLRSKGSGVRVSARKAAEDDSSLEELLKKFFKRQRDAVLPKIGAKAANWWDSDRWDKELASELYSASLEVTSVVARRVLAAAGVSPEVYSVLLTSKFLEAVAESRAALINGATLRQLEATGVDDVEPADVFENAIKNRSSEIAGTLLTTFAAFAAEEAARQGGGKTKTWVVTSLNPRLEHAALNGETVGIDELFSNGAKWPGDPVLGAEGVSRCLCDLEITFP